MTFGIFADSIERVKKWSKRSGKKLRGDIQAGLYEGKSLPAWAVRTEAPARTKPHLDPCSRSDLPARCAGASERPLDGASAAN